MNDEFRESVYERTDAQEWSRNGENKLKCGERKLVLNEINDAVSLLLQSTGDSFTAISIFVET